MQLELYLTKHNISQTDFANRLGKPITTIWRYINGERIPSKKIMPEIFRLTNGEVTANDFYEIPNIVKQKSARSSTNGK